MADLKQTLIDKGIALQPAPVPVGNYRATIESGNLVFISGQLPLQAGVLVYKGRLGKELSIAEGKAAAEICALNLLSQLAIVLETRKLQQIVKLEGFINCADSFTGHAEVLNGASDILAEILGEQAGHTRTVMGCASLPLDAAIEIAAIAELE